MSNDLQALKALLERLPLGQEDRLALARELRMAEKAFSKVSYAYQRALQDKKSLQCLLQRTSEDLQAAMNEVSRLVESAHGVLEDVAAWARAIAMNLQASMGWSDLAVYQVQQGALEPIKAALQGPAPSLLQAMEALAGPVPHGEYVVVPVRSLTGEVLGALSVRGLSGTGRGAERQVLSGFASQLGSALDMVRVRRKLQVAEAHRSEVLEDLHARGIDTLQVCPVCGGCYDHREAVCPVDGQLLDIPGVVPYRIRGRYRFRQKLGEGGMGTVFEAQDESLDRLVALKLMRPELFHDATARLRFEREARTLVQVNHPGVVTVFDSGEVGEGSLYLVMERLRGLDLHTLVRCYGPGSARQVARLLRQGAEALAAAHRVLVVHRDIKPHNLFLVPGPEGFQVKILDFGLAKSVGHASQLTLTGYMMGTPAYLAPEQILGKEADARSDGYAFACVVYEALVGRPAAQGDSLHDTLQTILFQMPPAPSTLAPWLSSDTDAAFRQALAKEPDQRPVDLQAWAQDLATHIERLEDGGAGWPEPIPPELPSGFRPQDPTACLTPILEFGRDTARLLFPTEGT